MQLVSQLNCPRCGAPLRVGEGQRHAICPYCSASVVVAQPPAAPVAGSAPMRPAVQQDGVSPADIEQIKSLVMDGKRDEAVALYQRVAAVDRPAAEQAVDQLSILSLSRMTGRLPLNGFGFALYFAFIGLGVAMVVWGALRVAETPTYALLVIAGALFAVWRIAAFVPKLRSNMVQWFGPAGRARVVKATVLSAHFAGDGVLKLVLFEVQPDAGGAPFVDEEVLALHPHSSALVEPGNVILARFDGGRTRVFPVGPITVVARVGDGYRG